jgi:lipid A 3-O-deacylase
MNPNRSLPAIVRCGLRFVVVGSFLLAPATWGAHEWFLDDPPQLNLNVGAVGVLDTEQVLGWGIEYRPAFRFYHVGPWFQLAQGAEYETYASLGVLIHLHLGRNWILTPSFGGGYYNSQEGLDLGFDAQFRSGLELSRRFAGGHELGIGFAHLSNGSLSEENPGTESLMLTYTLPLHFLSRHPAPDPSD